ncbi:MAG: pantetheine-phosphate adenylyltransferase [Prevotella sp.]|nr:pantetheine-phosphate adenylyltransferase [Prevotella sp.]
MNRHSSRKAVFAGSFDPFHPGHANIVARALELFDEIVIGVGINEEKTYAATLEERVENIRRIYRDEKRVTVEANHGLTADFARELGAQCIIKGARNAEDFLYEQMQARWNREHSGIDTLLFFADKDFEELTSTGLRAKANIQSEE